MCDNLIKALRCCAYLGADTCVQCPRRNDERSNGAAICSIHVKESAADAIESLTAQLADVTAERDSYERSYLAAENERNDIATRYASATAQLEKYKEAFGCLPTE